MSVFKQQSIWRARTDVNSWGFTLSLDGLNDLPTVDKSTKFGTVVVYDKVTILEICQLWRLFSS